MTFWQLMGRLVGKQSKICATPPLQTPDDSYVFTDTEKSNLLSDYFCSISTIDDSNINLPEFNKRTNSSLTNITIDSSEVIDFLSNLKVNKASDPDGISHRMLKNTCRAIATPLYKLFNLSLQTNSFRFYGSSHMLCIFLKGRQITNKQLQTHITCKLRGKIF